MGLFLRFIIAGFIVLFFNGCLVSDSDDNSNDEKSEEYMFAASALEALFIYRDSLPDDLMAFATPELLYESVNEPYTYYFSPEYADYIWSLVTTENKGGMGIRVDSVSSGYLIYDVVPNSPANKAGLKKGDTIVAVNGDLIVAVPVDSLGNYLSGEVGESITLTIKNSSGETNITVVLDTYLDRSVLIDSLDTNIALIQLTQFSGETYLPGGSGQEFSDALDNTSWAEWTIFDLRDNGGGDLDHCIRITSEFVDSGLSLMEVRERAFNDSKQVYETQESFWYSGKEGDAKNRKFYILQDDGSASASEIVISSLKTLRTDIITVGDTTYGKARGQYWIPTPDSGISIITYATLTPIQGVTYDQIGIAPEIIVSDAQFALDTAITRIQGRGGQAVERAGRLVKGNRRGRLEKRAKFAPGAYKILNKIN